MAGKGATARERKNGEREMEQRLTADSTVSTASSGKGWSRRGGEDDLRRPEVKEATIAALQGFPRLTAWRRGRGRCGGAVGLVGEARLRRWLRQRRAVATAAFGGWERENQGRRESEGE